MGAAERPRRPTDPTRRGEAPTGNPSTAHASACGKSAGTQPPSQIPRPRPPVQRRADSQNSGRERSAQGGRQPSIERRSTGRDGTPDSKPPPARRPSGERCKAAALKIPSAMSAGGGGGGDALERLLETHNSPCRGPSIGRNGYVTVV